jgi:galactose mutarotase-like enzyme
MKAADDGLYLRPGAAVLLRQLSRRHAAARTTSLRDWQGLALESEFLPDSPNHPEWPQPDCVLRPGEEYVSLTEYQFIPHNPSPPDGGLFLSFR